MPAVVYATAADLTAYLGSTGSLIVSDRDGSGATDTGVIEAALAGASSTADSYLAKWLPLPEVPLALRECVLAIATYRLANNMETDDQRRRYEDAIQWLRDVAKGVASLGIPPAVEDPSASVGVVSFHTSPRLLTRCTTAGLL
jgi:phage gp36-like protein